MSDLPPARPTGVPVAAPVRLVVLQATAFCNIDCRYCYLPDRTVTGRMSFDTVTKVYERVRASRSFGEVAVTFAWHAGEPLAAGLEFFRIAFARAEAIGGEAWTHNIQTNGTLLDDQWAALFAASGTRIGLSIDGPAFLHDSMRVDRRNRGTFARTMRGLEALRRYGVEPSAIMVVTRASLAHADEIFGFFLDHGLRNVGINVEEQEGCHTSSSLTLADLPAWRRFLFRLLELQEAHHRRVMFREFEPFVPLLDGAARLDHFAGTRSSCATAFQILNVDRDGNMSTYCPELVGTMDPRYDNFRMGNVADMAIDDIAASPVFRRMAEEIDGGVTKCRNVCAYFRLCGGGQPANKYFEMGTFDVAETRYCQFRKKALTDVVLDYAERQQFGDGAR